LNSPTLDDPDKAKNVNVWIWDKDINKYVIRNSWLGEKIKTVYSIIWGQISDAMQSKVEGAVDYKTF